MKVEIFDESIEKFIQSLEKTTIAKIIHTIELLEKFGNRLGMPHSKKVFNKIFELRISGNQSARIFYVFSNQKAVLLHGFIKKSSKIPKKEIYLAAKRLKELE